MGKQTRLLNCCHMYIRTAYKTRVVSVHLRYLIDILTCTNYSREGAAKHRLKSVGVAVRVGKIAREWTS